VRNYDRQKAIKEAECFASQEAYFRARSSALDTEGNRKMFEAGFDRGYDVAVATPPACDHQFHYFGDQVKERRCVRCSVLESKASEPVADERECGNADCGWRGTTERMCGSVGPLCPECGEVTEASAPVAGEAQKPVATVQVTREGYKMAYVAYGLPEGMHDLYAAPKASEAVRDAAKSITDHLASYEQERGATAPETFRDPFSGKKVDNAVTVPVHLLRKLADALSKT